MGDQQQRGRGRARGRARGAGEGQTPRPGGPQQARGGPQQARGGPPPQQFGGQPRGMGQPPPVQQTPAWGPRPQLAQQQQIRSSSQEQQPIGRATQRAAASGPEGPGGDTALSVPQESLREGGGNTMRRGTYRGNRPMEPTPIIRTRPASLPTKLGTHGQSIRLSANYFKLIQTTDWCLYQYRVDIAPSEDRTNVKKALFRRAVTGILAGYVFDGTVLYTSNRLSPDPMEVFAEDDRTNEKFRFTLRIVGDVAAGDFQYLQFFNIIMRKCLGYLNLQLVGRNFFDAVAKVRIPQHRMELWPGYVTSIRQHEQSILMCCEVTHKVMRHDTVLHLLSECAQEDHTNFKQLFQSRIIGSVVLTEYNNRTYRIDDVDFKTTPSSTFSKRDGTTLSYIQYYREKYNLRITSTDQPMLVSRAKAREIRAGLADTVLLVPELCRMTGLTDAQRANFQLMRSLADHTRMAPGPRIEKLQKFSQRLAEQENVTRELRLWNWKLSRNLIELSGRVLPPETVSGGNKMTYSAGRDVDWTRELRSRPMLYTVEMKNWVVVCPNQLKASTHSFLQILLKAAEGMRWRLPMPRLVEIPNDRPATILDGLETAFTYNPQLVMCVVGNNKADRYAAIKKKCYVDKAVSNQVILAKNLESKGVMSIATKVAIQMNCKLGGAPWMVPLPYKNMMVIGYDVCHDTNRKERSFGATVATLSTECARYFSTVTAHVHGEEISNDFGLTAVKACHAYRHHNGHFPEKIMIYRDGVGDGQLAYVFQHEVQSIRTRLAELYGSVDNVKMVFIVVSKRINTRIFSNGQNPTPGTVVDDVITLPERYDFFIVSQCVRQGTVSPTSYNVLFDNMGQSADKIQRVTYKLTHMYYNWSGTVRVPAPCQYAHKLAFLVAQSLHRNPHAELENVLYFL